MGSPSSLLDTGCRGTRMDRAILPLSARQRVAAECAEWRGRGCGAGSQHCTAVPTKDWTQPGTHTGHPRGLRETWDRSGGQGHFCLPQAHQSRPGSDPRGAGRGWGSPFSSLFILKGGRILGVLLGGRIPAPTLLLSPSLKDVTAGTNCGRVTLPTPDPLDAPRPPSPGPGQLSRCITVLGAEMETFPSVTSRTQQTRDRTGEDTSSNGHMLRAQLWGFPPVPSQNHCGYQGTYTL